jgi:hypothetical protein
MVLSLNIGNSWPSQPTRRWEKSGLWPVVRKTNAPQSISTGRLRSSSTDARARSSHRFVAS